LPVVYERKSLFARRDLVDRLQEHAHSRGISFYNLVNSVFEAYVKLLERGVDLEECVQTHLLLTKAMSMGYILVPANTWIQLLERASGDVEMLKETWRDLGVWLAKYFSEERLEDPLRAFSQLLKYMGASEVEVRSVNESLELKIVGLNLRRVYAEILAKLVEGFLASQGYIVSSLDVLEGVVILRARRERQ
jgi:hypothetical protein